MAKLDKDDLAQMEENYFKSLEKERLVEVAKNLHTLAIDLWEKEQENSQNSSQPPSKDNPYSCKQKQKPESSNSESESAEVKTEQKQLNESSKKPAKKKSNRKPGKQPERRIVRRI